MSETLTFNANNTVNPTESPKLKDKFASLGLPNLKQISDSLASIGIHPEFADELGKMLASLNASTTEILDKEPEIREANRRLEPKLITLGTKGEQRVYFSTLQAAGKNPKVANDDSELSKAA